MSSNREGGRCDAVLHQATKCVGPLRLPMNREEDFVKQFNRIYRDKGMMLEINAPPDDDESAQAIVNRP